MTSRRHSKNVASHRDVTAWHATNGELPEDDGTPQWGHHRVYVAHCQALGLIKIGYSHKPTVRLKTLENAVRPHALKLIGTLNGGRRLEAVLHATYAEDRVNGEWFKDSILPKVKHLILADKDFYGPDLKAHR